MDWLLRLEAGEPRAFRAAVWIAAAGVISFAAAVAAFIHPAVAFAVALGALAAPIVLGSLDAGLIATVGVITLLPFAAIPLNVGFNPTLLDFGLGAVYAVWAVQLATRHTSVRPLPWPTLGVAAFMGIAAAAFVAGLEHGVPTKNQMRTFMELVLGAGLFFVVNAHVRDTRYLRRLVATLIGFGTVASLIGLALYLLPNGIEARMLSILGVLDYPTGADVIRFLNDDPARLQRATGTSVDPNSFGGMLAAVAALALPQVLTRSPMIDRRLATFSVVILVVGLLATVSRGSLLGFAAAVGLIGLVKDRRVLLLGIAAVVTMGLVAGFLPWTAGYVGHFVEGLALQDRATQMRLGEYTDAVTLIRRYPVLGVGFGAVRDIDLYRGVSSLYLIVAESMGLVGLGAFVAVMGAFLARMAGAWRLIEDEKLRAVALGASAAVVSALVSGVFDHYFFSYPHAFALLWLVIAVGTSASRLGLKLGLK